MKYFIFFYTKAIIKILLKLEPILNFTEFINTNFPRIKWGKYETSLDSLCISLWRTNLYVKKLLEWRSSFWIGMVKYSEYKKFEANHSKLWVKQKFVHWAWLEVISIGDIKL